ncbi:PREDICTED: late embryogenesis abundant [Prunus dulcis]|uniref:PREDICTED: late embryogenesis abundant n=1 Tax=Prunus dulcis TaxID=3755 RepID=A0A5E4FVC1_PRUDU|nr:PREDICTED: late embryogenesis abundant [Prunus dulcis]
MAWKTSDAESLQSSDELKRQKKIKMAIYISIFVVFQIIVITTMSLTVMKVKTPRFRLGNINVQNFEAVPATPSFDTKFTTQIKIKNSANWGSYKFNAANITFQHQGATLAVIDIAKGKAGWLSTIKRTAEVSLKSSAINGSNFGSELSSGVLTLNSVGRLNGKVAIMFIMKKKKAANMNCTIAFDVAAKTLKSLQCK